MPVITINGPIGSGSVTIGQMVAQQLELDFVDRLVFTQAARIVGSPVKALIAKEEQVDRLRDRMGRFLQTMLERSAMSGVSGEPYFGRGIENLPAETYMDLGGEGGGSGDRVDDKAFIDATSKVVNDIYQAGNAVIIGRGANAILADAPGTLHVALIAPLDFRVETMMEREHFTKDEAEVYVQEIEQAREGFFKKYWKVDANDPSLYHMVLNIGKMKFSTASEVIAHAAGDLAS